MSYFGFIQNKQLALVINLIIVAYYISRLVRGLRLVNFAGRILQYGPPNLKLFSAVKMSSETYFSKGLYADREKRRDTLQDEENLPNFPVQRRKSSQRKES